MQGTGPKDNHHANLGQASFQPADLRRILAPSSKLPPLRRGLFGFRVRRFRVGQVSKEHQARQAQLRKPFSCLRRIRLTSPRFVLEVFLGLQGSPKVGWDYAFGGVPSFRPLPFCRHSVPPFPRRTTVTGAMCFAFAVSSVLLQLPQKSRDLTLKDHMCRAFHEPASWSSDCTCFISGICWAGLALRFDRRILEPSFFLALPLSRMTAAPATYSPGHLPAICDPNLHESIALAARSGHYAAAQSLRFFPPPASRTPGYSQTRCPPCSRNSCRTVETLKDHMCMTLHKPASRSPDCTGITEFAGLT